MAKYDSILDTVGKTVSLDGFRGKPALLVMFICNHCPYVKHVADELARLGSEYMDRGVAALIRDLDDRGLLDSTLVVLCGEAEAHPVINAGSINA